MAVGGVGARGIAGLFLAAVVLSGAATAQEPSSLRERQRALGRTISEQPANLEAMFEYALVSTQLDDHEQAIATLERMLIFNPDLPRVQLELGVAYFRLGAYEVARFYFEQVLADDPPEAVASRVTGFLTEIERRTARNSLTGLFAIGPIYSTNANLGPPDREIRSEFFPGGVALIDADSVANADFGIQAGLSVTHSYDLRRPNDDAWVSTLAYGARRFQDEEDGAFDAITVTTGPRLALDDEAFGLKARPFIAGSLVRSANAPLYGEVGAGAEVSQTITPTLSIFGVGTIDWRDFESSRDSFDGLYGGLFGGVVLTPQPDREFRVAGLLRTDRTRESYTSSTEAGLRLTASRLFRVQAYEGFESFDLPWRASLFGQVSYRIFDKADPAVDASTTRQDVDARFGARLLVPLDARNALSAEFGVFERYANIRNYDFSSVDFGVAYVRFF